MRVGNRVLVSLGAAALIASAVSAASPSHAKAAPNLITFSTPNVMSPQESVGEPTIVHSPASDNTVYSSGPWGTGTQRSIWYASADLGETFRLVQQCPPQSGFVSTACPPPTAASGTANPPGGGDTDQRLFANGKDYFVDLWALACDRLATTTDRGATALQNAYGCNSPTVLPSSRPDGSDRQWLAAYDPALTGVVSSAPDQGLAPLMYMEYNNLQTVQTGCSYWVNVTNIASPVPANNDNGNFGCDGYPSVDQVTGKVFEASGCSNGTAICLNIGTPDASGNLCFLDDNGAITIGGTAHTCPNGGGIITMAGTPFGDPDLLFTVSSMDTGRNLHVTYTTSGSVSGSVSTLQTFTTVAPADNPTPSSRGCVTNCWDRWATPVQVSQAPSNVNVFPWVVAGGPGRSDSVWYGTDSFIDPSTNGGQQWNTWMAQAVWPVNANNEVTLAPPTTTMVRVSPHPSHYNSICLQGTGCITSQGDRNLADFFSVTIDHDGAAEVEYNDTTNGLEQAGFTPANGLADHAGAPVVTIARQDGGLGLYGHDVLLRSGEVTSAPVSGIGDPTGDALYPVIGGSNQTTFDLTGVNMQLSSDGSTLFVTMTGPDLSDAALQAAATNVTGTTELQFVTRWVMCPPDPNTEANSCTIYYAEMTANIAQILSHTGFFSGFAGQAQSIDLCSVSACDPHVEFYPDGPTATSVSAVVNCGGPLPGAICLQVPVADVGNPTSTSLLEEVGAYAFAGARKQSAITNPQAESDQLPLEIDGLCCFNFMASSSVVTPEVPWTPALALAGAALIGAAAFRRRRRGGRPA